MACGVSKCIPFLLLFFIVSATRIRFTAEGRAMPKQVVDASQVQKRNKAKVVVMAVRSLIGSSPPRCERRCGGSCRHCVAIQVPIVPSSSQESSHLMQYFYGRVPRIAYSRGDDISNYKPIYWKCKCANFIFSP